MHLKVSIAYITDRAFFYNTAVSIVSLKENKNAQSRYDVYLVVVDVEKELWERLYDLNDDNFQIQVIPKENSHQEFQKEDFPVTSTALIKFELPTVLENLDKVLYLDGDMLIQEDLTDLYATKLGENYVGAVVDILAMEQIPSALVKLHCEYPLYFNSGMMLMNLSAMRDDNIPVQLLKYKKEGINFFMDQDALNVVLGEKAIFLPIRYNYMVTIEEAHLGSEILEKYHVDFNRTTLEREQSAAILHLTGVQKPWKYKMPYLTDLFLSYYEKSPYADLDVFNPQEEYQVRQYAFPFDKVREKTKIALYGAGNIGKQYYEQLKRDGSHQVVLWVDENYQEFENTSYDIKSPEYLTESLLEVIVIAIKNQDIVLQVFERLERMGIDRDKIVWSIKWFSD